MNSPRTAYRTSAGSRIFRANWPHQGALGGPQYAIHACPFFHSDQDRCFAGGNDRAILEAELIEQGMPAHKAMHHAENVLEKRQQRREEAALMRSIAPHKNEAKTRREHPKKRHK